MRKALCAGLLLLAALWVACGTPSSEPPVTATPPSRETGSLPAETMSPPRSPAQQLPTATAPPLTTAEPDFSEALPSAPEPQQPRLPAPAPEPNPFDAIKAFIARMQSAAGALRAAPDNVEVGQQVDVTLTISPQSTEAALRSRLEGAGGVVDVGAAKIAPRMRAHLTAPPGATVAVVGSEERAVHDTDDTVWHWTVMPTRTGDLPFQAVLVAPVVIDGKDTSYDVRTFEARVTVFVTPATRARDFISANWQWLWTTLIVPGFLWWRARRPRPSHSPAPVSSSS